VIVRAAVIALVASACQHAPEPAPPAPPVAVAPPIRIWDIADNEPFAVVGDSLLAYDRKRDGIVEIATATGAATRFRKIANTPASGTPGMWVPVDGGYIVSWDERIVFIRDDGALSFGWMIGENSFYAGIGGGDVAWLGRRATRPGSTRSTSRTARRGGACDSPTTSRGSRWAATPTRS